MKELKFEHYVRLYWRIALVFAVIGAIVCRIGAPTLLTHLTSPRVAFFASMVRFFNVASLGFLCVYGAWVGLYVIAQLRLFIQRPKDSVGQWYAIRIPKPSDTEPHSVATANKGQRDADYIREMMGAIRDILDQAKGDRRIALELWRSDGVVTWSMWISHDDLFHHIYSMWQGIAPGCDVFSMDDPMLRGLHGTSVLWSEHTLATDAAYSLRTFDDVSGDPLDALVSGLTPQQGVQQIGVSLSLSTPPRGWKQRIQMTADALMIDARTNLDSSIKDTANAMLDKAKQSCIAVALRCVVIALDADTAQRQHDVLTTKLKNYAKQHGTTEQAWTIKRSGIIPLSSQLPLAVRQRWAIRSVNLLAPPPFGSSSTPILSLDELACLWHLPTGRHLNIARWRNNRYAPPSPSLIVSKQSDPPPYFDPERSRLEERIIRIAGGRDVDGTPVYLGVPFKSLTFHMQTIATTGAGKTHSAKVRYAEYLRIGAGFGVIDNKNDLIDDILAMIPDDRMDDVIVFDPTDPDNVVGLNILDPSILNKNNDPDFIIQLLESLIASTEPNWDSSAGMKELLRYGALTLMEGEPNPTIAHLNMLYSSTEYRNQVLSRVMDEELVIYWNYQFPKLSETQKSSLTALQRRLSPFLVNRTIRTICNQPQTTINFREIMDNRKIFLAKMNSDVLGKQVAAILTSLIMNLIVIAGFSRLDLPEHEREVWPLDVDEIQDAVRNIDPALYQTILERLRAMNIGFGMLHQNASQLGVELLETTLGIVQTRFILSAYGPDASIWMRQYPDARLTAQDWASIPQREEFYAAISNNGRRQPVCTVIPLPLWPIPASTIRPEQGNWKINPPAPNEQTAFLDTRLADVTQYAPKDRVRLLRDAPDVYWQQLRQRVKEQRHAHYQVLLEHPGRIADRSRRIKTISDLKVAWPKDIALAELSRLVLSFPRDTVEDEKPKGKSKGKGDKNWGNDAYQPKGSVSADIQPEVNNRKMGVATVMQPAARTTQIPQSSVLSVEDINAVFADIL